MASAMALRERRSWMARRSGTTRPLRLALATLAALVVALPAALSSTPAPAAATSTDPLRATVHDFAGQALWTRHYVLNTGDFETDSYFEITLPVDFSTDFAPGWENSFDFEPVTVSGTFDSTDYASGSETCDKHYVGTYDSEVGHSFRQTYRSPGYFWIDITVHGSGTLTHTGPGPECDGVAYPYEVNFPTEVRCGTTYVPQPGYTYPAGKYEYQRLPNNAAGVQTCTGELWRDGNGTVVPELNVHINAVDSAATGDTFPVSLVLRNRSTSETLQGITPVNAYGFGVANSYYDDPGEIKVVSGPDPAFPASLGPGQSSTHTIMVKTTDGGSVGLEAKATATSATSGAQVTDTHYGEADIGETPVGAQRPATVATGVALFLDKANKLLREQQARYANLLFQVLQGRLSDKAKRFYFGALNKLKITDYERALARWRGIAPELMALATPNKQKLFENGNVYLNETQFARFQQLHNAEMLRLTNEYLGGAYDTVANEARYWSQAASPEGRGRIGADIARWREYNRESGDSFLAAVGEAVKPGNAAKALQESDAALRAGFEKAVNALLAAREARIDELTQLAEKNPDGFIEKIADDTAGLGFEGFKVTAETLMGEAAFSFAGKVFTGAKAAITKFTDAVGVTTPKGAKALAKTTAIGERSAALGASYLDDLSEEAVKFIKLREMANIGGMPIGDVEITKDIVKQVNKRLRQAGYSDTEIELLFRPANPYKVEGAFAKVETVGVKNIAPIDLALGAPPSTLAETAIFRPRKPEGLPGFDTYSQLEQTLLRDRYKVRLEEFEYFHGIRKPIKDKKMKEMLKAFGEKPHTFDNIGKGREIKMRLTKENVGDDCVVLKYDYLEVQGKKLIGGGKPRPIGTDYDGAAFIDKNTRQLLKGDRLNKARAEFNRLGEKAARQKGWANPFHDYTAHGTDADAADYPFFAFYWLHHLKEAQAIREAQRLAKNYNALPQIAAFPEKHITSVQILSKTSGIYERHLLRVSEADASFGPANVVFTTPTVVP
jgi:hypothetical protein